MPSIDETQFAAIDFEGAGAQAGKSDAPVQIGIAVMTRGEILPAESLRSYIACETPITRSAQRVHGICAADLESAPTLLELWPEITSLLRGRYVVAHGAATEKRFLKIFPFHRFEPWVDTLTFARAVDPALASYSLSNLCMHYGVADSLEKAVPNFRWHDAYCDALASLYLLRHIVKLHNLAASDPSVLISPCQSHYRRLLREKSLQQ